MWILVDDERTLPYADIIVRDVWTAIKCIWRLSGILTGIIIDHDLGGSATGYDLLKLTVRERILPKNVQLITMNPVEKKNMEDLLSSVGYVKEEHGNRTIWRREEWKE